MNSRQKMTRTHHQLHQRVPLFSSTVKVGLMVVLAALFVNLKTSSTTVAQRRQRSSSPPYASKLKKGRMPMHVRKETRQRSPPPVGGRAEGEGSADYYDDADVEDESRRLDRQREERDAADEEWIAEAKGTGRGGKIAWLMSFPNSGTSFTSLLIRQASNATTATNYGMESNLGADGRSVPVYDWSPEGPYWLHPPRERQQLQRQRRQRREEESVGGHAIANPPAKTIIVTEVTDGSGRTTSMKDKKYQSGTTLGRSGAYDIPPPTSSIMTKTHCGSRCAFCSPQSYLETSRSFLINCLTGSRKVLVETTKESAGEQRRYEKRYHTYQPSLVERAIHLVRNPFDNIVSRFHHEQKEHAKRDGGAGWLRRYPNDVDGFRRWCADEDATYARRERLVDWNAFGYPNDIADRFEGVSCHGELFRYVQWHARAIRAAELLDVPVLRVYYEDYSTDLNSSTTEMLDFLGLERAGSLPHFDSNKDYSGYFTREERAAASDFMRRVAMAAGRGIGDGREGEMLLERYFVDLDFDLLWKQTKSIK